MNDKYGRTILAAQEFDLPNQPTAECWLWQIGNVWVASGLHDVLTWWDGCDDDPAEHGCPILWCRPIMDVPTTGTLVYRVREEKEVSISADTYAGLEVA